MRDKAERLNSEQSLGTGRAGKANAIRGIHVASTFFEGTGVPFSRIAFETCPYLAAILLRLDASIPARCRGALARGTLTTGC